MAKTESTAVNELIKLVETATPLKPDPTEDLMFKAPERASSRKVSPPRVSATIPSMKGAGEVAPLPRQRAPHGTQRGVPTVNDDPKATALGVAPVRISTAPVSRASSIPPIPSPPPALLDRPTRPSLPPPRPSGSLRTQAPPPAMPVAAPFPTPAEALQYPSAAPYMQHVPTDMTSNQAWFDQSALDQSAPIDGAVDIDISHEISGTARVAKTTDWRVLLPKLIAPTLGLILVGVFVGGYIAFDAAAKGGRKAHAATVGTNDTAKAIARVVPSAGDPALEPKAATAPAIEPKAETKPEPAPVAETKPEPAPVVEPKPETKPEPVPAAKIETAKPAVAAPVVTAKPGALVDVRIDSTPSGATVTLVDRGKTTFLGSTPISTAVDPSREYDLVLTIAGKAPHIEHLVPSKTQRLSIMIGKSSKAEISKPVVVKVEAPKPAAPKAEAPKKLEKAVVDPFAGKAEPKPETKPTPEVKPVDPKPEAKPAGEGILMVSSKPPCEIYVDGAPTGLTTPQRAIKLPAGKHKITLVNSAEKIKKTVSVTIGEEPTKVIENFMQ